MKDTKPNEGGQGCHLRWAIVLVLCCASSRPAGQTGELIERTLAIVGGQAITLADVRTAIDLGLVDVGGAGDRLGVATTRLIERMLILREVRRYAPPEPPDDAIERRLGALRASAATPEAFAAALADGGFSEARLRVWVRDDLRIAAYLDQRFAAAGTPTDEEVAAFYSAHRDEFDRAGASYEQAAPAVRERLAAARRAELITDWISDLRRRTPVVELWKN